MKKIRDKVYQVREMDELERNVFNNMRLQMCMSNQTLDELYEKIDVLKNENSIRARNKVALHKILITCVVCLIVILLNIEILSRLYSHSESSSDSISSNHSAQTEHETIAGIITPSFNESKTGNKTNEFTKEAPHTAIGNGLAESQTNTVVTNTEGSARQLLNTLCMAVNARYLTYEEALADKQISDVLPSDITCVTVTQVVTSDNFIWLYACSRNATVDNVIIEIETIDSADRLKYVKDNYKHLNSLLNDPNLISNAQKYNLSIFVDGYDLEFYKDTNFYHVVIAKPDVQLLSDVINML